MPERTRVGEIARVAARHPVRTVLGLLAIAMFVAQQPILFRRQRRTYLSIARQLGLTDGEVLRQTFAGGLTTPQLTLITLRAGDWPVVLIVITSTLARSGYRPRAPVTPYSSPPRRLSYRPPRSRELPGLLLSVYGPGETIEHADVVVPAGQTGLECSLA
jgi:hypothetical protein